MMHLIERNENALTLSIAKQDAVVNCLVQDFYSDSDHASAWSRKSTSGAAHTVEGRHGTIALVAEGSKGQPSVAKSSGEAEMKGVDEVMKAIADEPTTEVEATLIRLTAPKSKAAVGGVARIAYPTMDLLGWLSDGRGTRIEPRYLHIDASVALTNPRRWLTLPRPKL